MHHFTKSLTAIDHASLRGRLHLRLTGFSQNACLSVDDVVRAIDVLPGFQLEGLREIAYLTEDEARLALMYAPAYEFTHCKGTFIQHERRIVIYGFENRRLFFQVLYHEIGHYVYYLVISSKVKKHWVMNTHRNFACLTPYACTNASEDFAETYAGYILEPENLRNSIPEKYAYMHDVVFSGNPDTLKEKYTGQC